MSYNRNEICDISQVGGLDLEIFLNEMFEELGMELDEDQAQMSKEFLSSFEHRGYYDINEKEWIIC